MSYILDALRRADAERERGAVPNIHAQPYAAPSGETDTARTTPPWLWIALALLAVAVLALAWKLFAGDPPREQVAAVAPVAQAPAPAAVPPGPAPGLAPPAPSTSPLPSPVPLQPVQPRPITSATSASRAAAPPARAASRPAARAEAASAAALPVPAPASTPASAAERIYAVSELPEDVRRSLPALPIGGAMYSKNAADRMLIVGGQILHEGDTIAPELKLEQIRLKSAVFRYKSYRYEVSY